MGQLWPVKTCGFFSLIFLLVLGIFLGSTAWDSDHDFSGRCEACHLTDPQGEASLLFVRDIDELCQDCHNLSVQMSHPTEVIPTMTIPEVFPLDWRGRLTCATCHNPHLEGDLRMRSPLRGRPFCELCHDPAYPHNLHGTGGIVHSKSLTAPDDETFERLLDRVSLECLQCHDGAVAPEASYRMAGEPALTYQERFLSHPIGVDYRQAAEENRGLKPMEMLSPRISLYEGLVGCASCHDPYSRERYRLTVTNRRSALCLECHLK